MDNLILCRRQTPIEIALDIDQTGHTTAKKLYEWLELDKTQYSRWIKKNIIDNNYFREGEDFSTLMSKTPNQIGRPSQDFLISAPMAKSLAMASDSPRGEETRQYFIKVEAALAQMVQKPVDATNFLENPDILIKALEAYKEEKEKVALLQGTVETMAPKAEYYDEMLSTDGTFPVKYIAQEYGMSSQKFNKLLNGLHIQYKCEGNWVLYNEYADKGYAILRPYRNENGYQGYALFWTEKGKQFVYQKLKENGIGPIHPTAPLPAPAPATFSLPAPLVQPQLVAPGSSYFFAFDAPEADWAWVTAKDIAPYLDGNPIRTGFILSKLPNIQITKKHNLKYYYLPPLYPDFLM